MRNFAAALLLTLLSRPLFAASTPIVDGERFTIHSTVLGEDRTIFVSLPPSYQRGSDRYPVLYLTDAQWQFDQMRATAAFLARNDLAPELIVIGVTSADRTRDLYSSRSEFRDGNRVIPFPNSGNGDRFLDFFETELIPWVESNYRTTPLRILAGHSAGGNFALHAMRVKPALFQAVIAASPWLAWDDRKELQLLLPFLKSNDVKVRTLFLSCASEGAEMRANLDALMGVLRERKNRSVRWDFVSYPNETHDSTVVKSYFDGLRTLFDEWPLPRDPKTNALIGTLDDVKKHYAGLGERLGAPSVAPEGAVNELGYQLLRSGDVAAAIAAFRYNTEIHSGSANAWDSLGDGLERAGKREDALASVQKAVSIATASGDPSLDSFRKHAAKLASDAARP